MIFIPTYLKKMHKIKQFNKYYFCFFTRNGGCSNNEFSTLNCAYNSGDLDKNVEENRKIASNYFMQNKIIIPNQNHSNKVLEVNYKNDLSLNADAIITERDDILLGILTADCAPIIILGENKFGIIHAGWKGLLNGIIENTINKLISCGEKIEKLNVFVGPHLKEYSFEVKKDFIEILKKKVDHERFINNVNERFYFDFSKLIEEKLKKHNIINLNISSENTFTNPKKFFSHRFNCVNKIKKCGRQISLVGIKIK